ncbi:MAG: formylglycine-generating enzyme family protein [Lentisphaeria bacterium]|nr:formylglycine-generating enzyme family protein [Lentisphaeria bacterium]
MALRDFIRQKSEEQQEKERLYHEHHEKELQEAALNAVPVSPHPLRDRDVALLDDYVMGQLILRDEIKPLDDGKLLHLFARSLGIAMAHLEEIKQIASLYDDQAKSEHLDKLALSLDEREGVVCFLCDIAKLHGENYEFKGEVRDYWNDIGVGIFHFSDRRMECLERLCCRMTTGGVRQSEDNFGDVPEAIIAYCLPEPTISVCDYLVIDLSGGPLVDKYPFRYTDDAPDPADNDCRTFELWLRHIPSGVFTMGSPHDEIGRCDNEMQHIVTLSDDYFIGVFPITQCQWKLVMGDNPSYFKELDLAAPVEQISYNMVCGVKRHWPSDVNIVAEDSFLGRLRKKTGLDGFDLPTEAQWEYACRAGISTALNNNRDLSNALGFCENMDDVGWFNRNANGLIHPVGLKRPNAWGLYDMHGGVWEWCRDWYGFYPTENTTDPKGPGSGAARVSRGGCWSHSARDCRSAYRNYCPPENFNNCSGMRICLEK